MSDSQRQQSTLPSAATPTDRETSNRGVWSKSGPRSKYSALGNLHSVKTPSSTLLRSEASASGSAIGTDRTRVDSDSRGAPSFVGTSIPAQTEAAIVEDNESRDSSTAKAEDKSLAWYPANTWDTAMYRPDDTRRAAEKWTKIVTYIERGIEQEGFIDIDRVIQYASNQGAPFRDTSAVMKRLEEEFYIEPEIEGTIPEETKPKRYRYRKR